MVTETEWVSGCGCVGGIGGYSRCWRTTRPPRISGMETCWVEDEYCGYSVGCVEEGVYVPRRYTEVLPWLVGQRLRLQLHVLWVCELLSGERCWKCQEKDADQQRALVY